MKMRLSVLPNLYQAVLYYVLRVTPVTAICDLWNVSGSEGAKRLNVPQ
jgi:hypothetical protein